MVFIERTLGNFNLTQNSTGILQVSRTPFIEQTYNDGITTGCAMDPLRYCPQNKVIRQEMSVFIVRAFGILLP